MPDRTPNEADIALESITPRANIGPLGLLSLEIPARPSQVALLLRLVIQELIAAKIISPDVVAAGTSTRPIASSDFTAEPDRKG